MQEIQVTRRWVRYPDHIPAVCLSNPAAYYDMAVSWFQAGTYRPWAKCLPVRMPHNNEMTFAVCFSFGKGIIFLLCLNKNREKIIVLRLKKAGKILQ